MQDESFEMRQDRFVHSHFYKTLPIVLWDSKAACLLLKTAVRKTRSFCAIDIFKKNALFLEPVCFILKSIIFTKTGSG